MTGFEFKDLLIDERVKFVELAGALGIAPQTVQARFRTKNVSLDFVREVEEYLGKEPGYFEMRHTNRQLPQPEDKDCNIDKLISLCERQSEQISDLLARQDRLLALLESNLNNK